MKKNILSIMLLCLVLTGCQTAPVSTKTPLELQAIQAKEFETTKKIAFAATLSVLQDLGYITDSASFETGLITAKSPMKNQFKPFVGKVMMVIKVTAFIEEISPGRTKIRINFLDSRYVQNSYGRQEEERAIEEAEMYQSFYSKVQQAIFVRKNTQ